MEHRILNYCDTEIWVGIAKYDYPKNDEELRKLLDVINNKYHESVELIHKDYKEE